MAETWKPVVGFEGFYEVSDQGRVRGVAKTHMCKPPTTNTPCVRRIPIRDKKLTPDSAGYLKVRLCRDGDSWETRNNFHPTSGRQDA